MLDLDFPSRPPEYSSALILVASSDLKVGTVLEHDGSEALAGWASDVGALFEVDVAVSRPGLYIWTGYIKGWRHETWDGVEYDADLVGQCRPLTAQEAFRLAETGSVFPLSPEPTQESPWQPEIISNLSCLYSATIYKSVRDNWSKNAEGEFDLTVDVQYTIGDGPLGTFDELIERLRK